MISLHSDAASGWAGWALAHLEFGSSVNPITTRGADYGHHITASPPGFENPVASLYDQVFSLTTLILEGRELNFSSLRMKGAIQKKDVHFWSIQKNLLDLHLFMNAPYWSFTVLHCCLANSCNI